MVVENEKFAIKAGTRCFKPKDGIWIPKALKNANIVDGVLQEDLECRSPSTVAWIVLGRSNNGWELWKTVARKIINRYRKS